MCITPAIQTMYHYFNLKSEWWTRISTALVATTYGLVCLCCPLKRRACPSGLNRFYIVTSCSLVTAWMMTGHWALNDFIGLSIAVTMLSVIKLPSLKVSITAASYTSLKPQTLVLFIVCDRWRWCALRAC